jgi:isopenicillin-N epimerase
MPRNPAQDTDWTSLKAEWNLRPGVVYLNHGSFGPPPRSVRLVRQSLQDRLDSQPMDFLVRELEPWLAEARQQLARFVGAATSDLAFVENATVGMNIVADSFPLSAGDEVLLTDHEYGAVRRIWERACQRVGAKVVTVELPLPFQSAEETAEALFAAATERTRLVVVSHISSPTAVTLPVAEICRRAQQRGIAVAIDGPHAVAQLPLIIDKLGCDFYTASCHKWLSGPIGSGFLYVAPRQQEHVRPPVLSWGRLPPGAIDSWADEFTWSGTRNPTAYLAVPAAIDFLESVGLEAFRARTHWLARYARQRITELTQLEPIVPDDPAWYGSMAHVPLASTTTNETCAVSNPLQNLIRQRFNIEVPIVDFRSRRYIRVSCHLYNDTQQIDRLVLALGEVLAKE